MLEELEAKVLHLQRPAISHQAASKGNHRVRFASLQLQDVVGTITRETSHWPSET